MPGTGLFSGTKNWSSQPFRETDKHYRVIPIKVTVTIRSMCKASKERSEGKEEAIRTVFQDDFLNCN